MRRPASIEMALWTDYLVFLPINGEVSDIIALSRLRLPTGIRPHGTDDLNAQVSLTSHQQICINIARIQQVFLWRHFFFHERQLDGFGHGHIWNLSDRRLHISNEMWALIVAGLGDMRLVASLRNRPFVTKPRLCIVW